MTMTRGKLWIITDEELIVQPVFYQEIPIGVSHNKGIIKFVELYQLGIKVDEDDYHKAPCTIAEMGHIVLKTEDSIGQLVMYIPEKVTDRQLAWVIMNQYELLKYMKVSAFSLKNPKQEDNLDWKHLHGMIEIMKELKEKNLINIQEKKGNKLM